MSNFNSSLIVSIDNKSKTPIFQHFEDCLSNQIKNLFPNLLFRIYIGKNDFCYLDILEEFDNPQHMKVIISTLIETLSFIITILLVIYIWQK